MAERKKYIEVKIPILEETVRVLGTPKELDNKTIKLDLTRKLRGKGLTITFRIINNKEELLAVPNKMELVKSYIRKVTRKRTDYVEDSFKASCQDARTVVKPFLVTRKRVSRAVRRNLRNTTRELLLEHLKQRDYNEVCQEILDGVLQKSLLPKLKKIYPLSFCDIRVFETKEIEKVNIENIIKNIKNKKVDPEEISEVSQKEEND